MEDDVKARAEIYQVLVDYCKGADTRDMELLQSTFHDESADDHAIFVGNGKDFAAFLITQIREWFILTKHTITNVSYRIQGDTADVECQVNAYHEIEGTRTKVEAMFGKAYADAQDWTAINGTPHEYIYSGRYYDQFRRVDGRWAISSRVVLMDWYKVGLTRPVPGGVFEQLPVNSDTRIIATYGRPTSYRGPLAPIARASNPQAGPAA